MPPRVLMVDTQVESTVLAMPQDRNFFGRVFGGFLMRTAFEAAYNCAYLFSGSKPAVVEVGDVSFDKPVHIGASRRAARRSPHSTIAAADHVCAAVPVHRVRQGTCSSSARRSCPPPARGRPWRC